MVRHILVSIRLATAFLTRIPGTHPAGATDADFARAHAVFPLVGLLIGSLIAVIHLAGVRAGLPPLCSAAFALAAGAWLTGTLHEDGLSDMIDNFGGGRGRDRKLEIMRDSRVGTYGALSLVLMTICKVAAIAQPSGVALIGRPAVSHAISRSAATVLAAMLPTARRDGLSIPAVTPGPVVVILLVCSSTVASLMIVPMMRLPVVAMVTASVVSIVATLAGRQIGGQTGDVLGATEQVTETAVLLALVARPALL